MRYQKKRVKIQWKKIVAWFVVMALLTGIILVLYQMYEQVEVSPISQVETNTVRAAQTVEEAKKESKTVEDVIEEVNKSVVGISKIKSKGSSIFLSDAETQLGLGTGVIVSENGYIITNWHVAGDKLSNCYVTLESGQSYNGNVVWADEDLDLAMVKINMKDLDYVKLGDSDTIRVGQAVYAIGNPIGFEFQRTVTAGIISAVNRTIKIEEDDRVSYMEDLIQTDATINPGNSGGPLIDIDGNMVGINSIKIESAESIGFAIPINIVKPIINSFLTQNTFEEAYIGISAYDREVIPYLDSDKNFTRGIYVALISLDSPCYKSGLKMGDIIVAIDNYEVNKMSELRSYVYTKKPGEEVVLKVDRNNKEMEIKVKLGTK